MAANPSRRQFLTGLATLAAGSMAGCVSADDARLDLSVIEHDRLPTRASEWDPECEMSLSGYRLDTREGAGSHRVDIARLNASGEWCLDVVDLLQYGDDGEPVEYLKAEDLAEGGTVVLLAAHNERGVVVSPDCRENSELNALLPD